MDLVHMATCSIRWAILLSTAEPTKIKQKQAVGFDGLGVVGLKEKGILYEISETVSFCVFLSDSSAHILPVHRTLTTDVGESVTLYMVDVNSPTDSYRWKHNGDTINEWNDMLTVTIPSVASTDGGIY